MDWSCQFFLYLEYLFPLPEYPEKYIFVLVLTHRYRDIDRYCAVYQGNGFSHFHQFIEDATMGLQRSFKLVIYLSILNIQILTDNVDCRSLQYCNVLNDVFFERRANITQSTIYLSILNARSCQTPFLMSKKSLGWFYFL